MTEVNQSSHNKTRNEFKLWAYTAYARAFRPRRKPRKRRPTDRGQMVITGAVLAAALGLNTDSSFVYQLFALLLCLAIASRIALRISRPNVSVERLLPKYATAGQTFSYRIRVTNTGAQTESDLTISDMPTQRLPSKQQYRESREPDESSRNAYDRFIGFHRFIYLQKQLTGISTTPGSLEELPVKNVLDIEVEATALRRGRVEMAEILVLHQDPLGLNYGFNHYPTKETLLVLPKRYRVNLSWQRSTGYTFQSGGKSSSRATGESDEFVSLRDYRDGDSMRKIHWPSSAKQAARKQSLVVKEYQDEFLSRNALIIDINHSDQTIVEETVSVAASFAMALNQDDATLDLIYLENHQTKILTAGSGGASANQQLEALATIQPSNQSFELLAEAALRHAPVVTNSICVFANWQEEHVEFVHQLTARGLSFRCLVISDDALASGPYSQVRTQTLQADLLIA